MPSQLMMDFSWQIAHHDIVVLMNSVASRWFVGFSFAKTFGLKVKEGSSTLVLGNDDQVHTDMHIKVHVKTRNIP